MVREPIPAEQQHETRHRRLWPGRRRRSPTPSTPVATMSWSSTCPPARSTGCRPSSGPGGPRRRHRRRRPAPSRRGWRRRFLALTEGDNRNVMAAQIAIEKLAVGRSWPRSTIPCVPRRTRNSASPRSAGRRCMADAMHRFPRPPGRQPGHLRAGAPRTRRGRAGPDPATSAGARRRDRPSAPASTEA